MLAVGLAAPRPSPRATMEEYTAAFVELRAQTAGTGPATLALNVLLSSNVAEEAASRGADILVLPEYGLSGFGSGRDAWVPFLEQLPQPPNGAAAVPCNTPEEYKLAPSLVGLSCAAREHAIAIVANIGDLIYCDADPGYPGCDSSRDGRLQFNTAIAFDSEGRYVAKAHKQNLWGEAEYFDEPANCPLSSFQITSRMGVAVDFGLFTCADLIYEFPPTGLLKEGLLNFVAPMAWSDEMAQMQALPSYQAWSLAKCINLVATNHRGPSMSGSGAFSCGRVLAATFSPGINDGPMHLVTLPARPFPGSVPPGLSHHGDDYVVGLGWSM